MVGRRDGACPRPSVGLNPQMDTGAHEGREDLPRESRKGAQRRRGEVNHKWTSMERAEAEAGRGRGLEPRMTPMDTNGGDSFEPQMNTDGHRYTPMVGRRDGACPRPGFPGQGFPAHSLGCTPKVRMRCFAAKHALCRQSTSFRPSSTFSSSIRRVWRGARFVYLRAVLTNRPGDHFFCTLFDFWPVS